MKVRLVPVLKSPQEKSVAIRRTPFVIGRAADCDFRLENPTVSRHHCEVSIVDGEVRVRDLGSSNGTFVNSQLIFDERILADGDTLCIVANLYRVELHTSGSGLNLLLQLGRAITQART